MKTIAQLETPALVLDAAVLERNVERMRARLARQSQGGVVLRPHVKTPKSIEVSRLTMASAAGPITVSTLKEAEEYFAHGVTDILYAVPIAPAKLEHVADLRQRGADLRILVENLETARVVVASQGELAAQHPGFTFPTLLEIDSDGHRSGIAPGSPRLLEIAEVLRAGGVPVLGVMTHAGSSYQCRSHDELRKKAAQERLAVVSSAEALRRAGHAPPVVSVGSTPTALFAEDLSGVTEVRAGVYVFFDLVMVGIDVCGARRNRDLGSGHGDRAPAGEGLARDRRRLDGNVARSWYREAAGGSGLRVGVRRRRPPDSRLDRVRRHARARTRGPARRAGIRPRRLSRRGAPPRLPQPRLRHRGAALGVPGGPRWARD